MFVLRILEKNKETRLKFSQESVTYYKVVKLSEVRVKLTNTQLNKIIQSIISIT